MQNQKALLRTPYQKLILMSRSIYGLPFVALGALLPGLQEGRWPTFFQLGLFTLGFIVMRASGMAFNHLIDRTIDAKNPRTKERPLPKGELTPNKVALIAWGSLFFFLIVTWFYSRTLFFVALPVSFLLWGYAYTKRFSMFCHFVLGSIHFFAPVMAYVAVAESINLSVLILGLVPFFAVAGSDILYAIDDLEFDLKEGLHSLPAFLGEKKAYVIARACQMLAIAMLGLFGLVSHLTPLFFIAPLALLGTLIWLHIMKSDNPLLFNGLASGLSLIFVLLDRLWAALL